MDGKTVVITGASRGLGFVTALALARKAASVLLLSRRSERSAKALAEVSAVATGPTPQFVECDQLDFSSVHAAVAELRSVVEDGIDVLCCNAGVMLQPDLASKDGYDITISTNVLSHFLLTKELMPQLERAACSRGEARVVNMSSGSAYGPPAFDVNFFSRSGGSLGGAQYSYERYHQSKLANLLFTCELHRRLKHTGSQVKALACTPGVCGTDMFVHAMSVMQPARPADVSAVASVEDGCLAQLKCICDPSVASGELYGPPWGGGFPIQVAMAPPDILVDEGAQRQLWDACEHAVGSLEL